MAYCKELQDIGWTNEQNEKFLAHCDNLRRHIEPFCKDMLMDDESCEFTVPTRNYRIIDEIPKFQSEIFETLENLKKIKRVALASPRGFAKSATCSIFFPIWAAVFRHFKEILVVSNSEALAINFLRNIKTNLEENERITALWGPQESDKWTETHIILKNGCSIRAVGWGAQIRGFRPDLIILDDIESDETVASEDIRGKMKDWILKAAINSLTYDGCMLFIGTLISRLSLLYEWINNTPEGWKSIFNQAYKDGIEEPGYEVWPSLWPHERLKARKAEIGTAAFCSEFLNNPIPADGVRFNPHTFKFFTDSDIQGKQLGTYIAIDPAFSESKTADFGVIMSCFHDGLDNIYVDSYYRRRGTAGDIIRAFIDIYRAHKNKIRAVGVETVGPQKAFYEQLQNECWQNGLYPPFKKLTGMMNTARGVMRNKKDRVTFSLQPRFEAGKIWFRKEQTELTNELTLFPEGRHDDLCDSLSYITSLVEPFMDYSQVLSDTLLDDDLPTIHRGITGYGDEEYETSQTRFPDNFQFN